MNPPKKPQPSSLRSTDARGGAGASLRPLPLAAVLARPAAPSADERARGGVAPGDADRVSRAWVGAAWCCSAVLLGAGLAWALQVALGGAHAWVAPLAAAVATLAAVLPITLLAPRLQAAPAGTAFAEPSPLAAALASSGVPRPLFVELASREWARARRHGSGAALLIIGIDRAARLAQLHGGPSVDALMATLLRQTAPTLRSADLLTLYSPSEVAVFLAPADATGALDVAERIRERGERLEVADGSGGGVPLRATVSVGVAHLRPAHLNLQALMDDAEDAAAAARQVGGNCVRAAPIEPGARHGAASAVPPARD